MIESSPAADAATIKKESINTVEMRVFISVNLPNIALIDHEKLVESDGDKEVEREDFCHVFDLLYPLIKIKRTVWS